MRPERSRVCFVAAALALLALLPACGRYSNFTLPVAPGGDTTSFTFDQSPEPVLARGAGWESSDVLNPSVARGPGAALLNFYSGFDGKTWRTGLATSNDGLHWRKLGALLWPEPATWESDYIAANGSALFDGGQLWYWYQAGPKGRPQIGLARSNEAAVGPDALRKESSPVLRYGPYMSWDEQAVADPYVLRIGRYFFMYYLGQDRGSRQRLGVARSADGLKWEKLRSNPVLDLGGAGAFDENGLGEPAVWSSHGFYWMLYTGRDSAEHRRLGLARSVDGIHWRKLPAVFSGSQPWDSTVICDPTVDVSGSEARVWFGGGDAASPDEHLNGQIGYGVLKPVPAGGHE
jgi:predicted GH43/DUF377 family glycosyl hydrolase